MSSIPYPNAYSEGRWGAHLTRSQLGAKLPGKVVWFRCPAETVFPALSFGGPADMARVVRERLRRRGIGQTILSDCPRLALLSICGGLDVWCRTGRFYLRDRQAARPVVRPEAEVAAVVEHLVRRYEELRAGPPI